MTCVYCGEIATTRDHIVPKRDWEGYTVAANLVPACVECNSALGAKDFGPGTEGVRAKANWLAGWYLNRYRKALSAPDWEDFDWDGVVGRLKKTVKALQAKKKRALIRLDTLRCTSDAYVHAGEFEEISSPTPRQSQNSGYLVAS